MKKFIIFAVSAIFCVAVAMPAVAGQVKVGGMVALDIYYFDQDGARQAGGVALGGVAAGNGFEQTVLDNPWAWNRVFVNYTSDDKTLGAHIDLRSGLLFGNQSNNWGEAYGWWKINPMIQFAFGRKSSVVSPYTPIIFMATGHGSANKGFGADFGNLFHGASVDQFLTTFTFSDMFSMQLSIVDPDTNDAAWPDPFAGVATAAGGLGAGSSVENEIPRIDVAFPINFGPVQIVPSLTYMQREYDEVDVGNSDDIPVWCASLGARFTFGPMTFTGEINAGENMDLSVSNFPGATTARPMTYASSGTSQIADASYVGYWADVAFKFGKATFHGIVGGQQTDCDGNPAIPAVADGSEYDISRTMYGITVPIMVSPGFFIQPELMFYDYGDDNEYTGVPTDDGEERVFGVQFKLVF